jgi:hypothetical protein
MRKYFAMYEKHPVAFEYTGETIEDVKEEIASYLESKTLEESSVMEIWSESTHPFESWRNPRYDD